MVCGVGLGSIVESSFSSCNCGSGDVIDVSDVKEESIEMAVSGLGGLMPPGFCTFCS